MPISRPWLCMLLTAALFASTLGGLERFWRQREHRATVVDDEDLWCQQRRRVRGADQIALIGASRLLLSTSLQRIRERFPEREPLQLAVGGMYPVATLRDLARDESFSGIAIVSMVAVAFEPDRWDDQEAYVRSCHRDWNLERMVGRSLRTQLEQRFVIMAPRVGLREVGRSWFATGRLPKPWWVFRFPDRGGYIDSRLRRDDLGDRVAVPASYAAEQVSDPARWLEASTRVEHWIERIESRGGRVALVRLPTSGRQWEWDEQFYPRALYWDAFAARTRAITLHFRDVPGLASLRLPDESHVRHRDIPAFTDHLIDALEERRLFRGRREQMRGSGKNTATPAQSRAASHRTGRKRSD